MSALQLSGSELHDAELHGLVTPFDDRREYLGAEVGQVVVDADRPDFPDPGGCDRTEPTVARDVEHDVRAAVDLTVRGGLARGLLLDRVRVVDEHPYPR